MNYFILKKRIFGYKVVYIDSYDFDLDKVLYVKVKFDKDIYEIPNHPQFLLCSLNCNKNKLRSIVSSMDKLSDNLYIKYGPKYTACEKKVSKDMEKLYGFGKAMEL